MLPGRRPRSDEENIAWEKHLQNLSKGYEGSPWLTALVNFSGFLAVFAGSMAAVFTIINLRNGTVWLPYALILAALVGTHICLRAVRFQRRRARRSGAEYRGRVTRDRRPG